MDPFSYLSVLISIVIGLGMSHLLGAMVRVIHNRDSTRFYWPSLVWAASLFLTLTLVWWADFNLNRHEHWTFAVFISALSVPAVLYVACGLVLPASETPGHDEMRATYFQNRRWFFSLVVCAVALTFLQTYLLDGHIAIDLDAELKALLLVISAIPIFTKADLAQKAVASVNFAWVLFYISLLFYNLRY